MASAKCPCCHNIVKAYAEDYGKYSIARYRCKYCWCEFVSGSKNGMYIIRTTIFNIVRRIFVPCKIETIKEPVDNQISNRTRFQ